MVHVLGLFEVEIAILKLREYKSPRCDDNLEELIQAVGETFQSDVHKLLNSIWNKGELCGQWKECYCISLQEM
jgi:hypothetical protein